ncbi:Protein transport protein SFT2-like Protein [Tribolium castaneum]|uniref:Vesicle transport protein n=1 Tax=Tribolium castaneum TaxID=7070 RepID=D6WYV8_TRICA|nr:PREDICTED: protein transport protein SFT2 [Tribolium castaneum]EFA09012.1 Protein transport protein SFT2-like Protein [Tribolium castaneum]|eukprot:XP_967760.1 PREDICTED: protein transport protein SFT2 [Tribolium castaneum]
MVDLKKDLDEYLLLQSDQKKSFKLQIPAIQKPNISNWFKREEQPEDNSWFQETKKGCCPTLSRFQRITLFVICIGMGILCFTLSLMYVPVLLFKARKFALLFTLGSLFFVISFFFLWGPLAYLKHMFSRERLLLTVTYGSTLVATLYCALHLQSTPFTVLCAVGQIVTLLWTVIANIPGGTTGISFFSKMFSRSVGNTLPI